MKINKSMQKAAADILTMFMFTKNMDDVYKIWADVYKKYDLYDDPFTGCPCTPEDYRKNSLEYEKQIMIEKYGYWMGWDKE